MIAVIDYGVGNLRSVEKAFQFIGRKAEVTSDRESILKADGVVLPGVGAYADAMKNLGDRGLKDAVKQAIRDGKLFLGICLGLQLLFDYSEEGGNARGLGIFRGAVKQLPSGKGLKVPHMGWNTLRIRKDCPLFRGLPLKPYVYFVHSYYLQSQDREIVAAAAGYGIEFDAAVSSGNVYATQFHPEKSGEVGLQILKNWADMMGGKGA